MAKKPVWFQGGVWHDLRDVVACDCRWWGLMWLWSHLLSCDCMFLILLPLKTVINGYLTSTGAWWHKDVKSLGKIRHPPLWSVPLRAQWQHLGNTSIDRMGKIQCPPLSSSEIWVYDGGSAQCSYTTTTRWSGCSFCLSLEWQQREASHCTTGRYIKYLSVNPIFWA